MSITETAREFFERCETGQGWTECAPYCHGDATFSCQADATGRDRHTARIY
jgi:hypothetical protein